MACSTSYNMSEDKYFSYDDQASSISASSEFIVSSSSDWEFDFLNLFYSIVKVAVVLIIIYLISTRRTRPKINEAEAVAMIQKFIREDLSQYEYTQLMKWIERTDKRPIRITLTECCGRNRIELPCKHIFCECSMRALLESQSLMKRPTIEYMCYCKAKIPASHINRILASRLSPNIGAQASGLPYVVNLPASSFTCNICSTNLRVDEGITLDCNDRFCSNCINDYITFQINSNQFDKIKCPLSQCNTPISESIIQAQVDSSTYQKLNDYRLKHLPDTQDERIVTCSKCDAPYYVDKNERRAIQCARCKTSMCMELIQQDLQIQGVKTCPKCKNGVTKDGGCNFVRCPYQGCRVSFCYLCTTEISQESHYSHFPKGPFQDYCETPR